MLDAEQIATHAVTQQTVGAWAGLTYTYTLLKRAETRNVGMDGWMEELADKSTQTRRVHYTTLLQLYHKTTPT